MNMLISYCGKHFTIYVNTMDCSRPGSPVHRILQARILEWVAIPFSRGSSRPRDRTQVSCLAERFFTIWATREALYGVYQKTILCILNIYYFYLSVILQQSWGKMSTINSHPSSLELVPGTRCKSCFLSFPDSEVNPRHHSVSSLNISAFISRSKDYSL